MDIMDIIKDSFVFPSKNIKLLLIFELLSIVAGAFSVIGTIVYVLGFISPECFVGWNCSHSFNVNWMDIVRLFNQCC